MKCTIEHDAPGCALPRWLCRTCNPELNEFVTREVTEVVDEEGGRDVVRAYHMRQVRKLRIEERRLSQLIDDVRGRDGKALNRLYEAIKEVEKQIDAELEKVNATQRTGVDTV